MTNDQYFKALEAFTVREMPNLSSAEVSLSLVKLLSRIIVSGAGGFHDVTECLLETVTHQLDIEVGRSLKDYALA